ncbi:hypothetical protein, partial [Duganella vulcania]|uniref:hypothetical protein n=1 Tax=Duganella vulcania TaxID=2692166 RepID=UPI001C2D1C8B
AKLVELRLALLVGKQALFDHWNQVSIRLPTSCQSWGGFSRYPIAVPPYAPGKMGELWVVRGTDGKFSIILSGYQPDHKDWPGRIKGGQFHLRSI